MRVGKLAFMWALLLGISCAKAALPADVARDPDVAAVRGGLTVVVGTTDGLLESALASDRTRLVQGLAFDHASLIASRRKLDESSLAGLATVVMHSKTGRMPYADNLVNLLIVDSTQYAPNANDLLRILAPHGVLLVWDGKAWARSIKPRPKDIDEWTHFDHGPEGSGESTDRQIGPPTHVQWRLEIQPYRGWGGNPAGYRPYSAFRVAGGRSFCIENQGNAEMATTKEREKTENLVLQARVAANGLPLWQRKIQGRVSGATHLEYHLIADAERVIWIPQPGNAPVALDAATGKELFTFDVPVEETKFNKQQSLAAAYFQLRMDLGVLLVGCAGKLHACDAKTGKRLWTATANDEWFAFPRILPGGRVIAQLVKPADGYKVEMRWPTMPTFGIACLNLSDGKTQWRVALPTLDQIPPREGVPLVSRERKGEKPAGPMRIGQSMLAGDDLYLFGSSGIGGSDMPGQIACLDLAQRKLKWVNWTGTWGYNLVTRGDRTYWFTPSTLFTCDPATGAVDKFFDAPFNNRCNRSSATGDWLVNGMGIWVDKAGNAIVRCIARSGCAQGPTLAQGMVLYTPNVCWCITQLRGHIALSAEPVLPPPADATRLSTTAADTQTNPANVSQTPFDGPIASEWSPQVYSGRRETEPVQHTDGRSYVAVIHEHRLECRRDGKTIWRFTAGGRISQSPCLIDDLVLFGSHDGHAYCLDAATGQLRWRFYAGGAPRQFVSHGQVESSWPVYNVVQHKGLACFSAGLHPETGGGIFVWGVDPKTGQLKWKHHLARTEVKLASAKGKISPNRVLNAPLRVEADGRLAVIGLSFKPDDDAATLQQQIDTMALKDALRNEGAFTLRGEQPAERR